MEKSEIRSTDVPARSSPPPLWNDVALLSSSTTVLSNSWGSLGGVGRSPYAACGALPVSPCLSSTIVDMNTLEDNAVAFERVNTFFYSHNASQI